MTYKYISSNGKQFNFPRVQSPPGTRFIQRGFEWRRRGERHESIAELQGRYQVPQDVLSLVIYSCLHVKTGQRAGPQYNASAKTSLHSRALHVRTDRFCLWLLSQHNLYMPVDVLYAGHPSQIRSTNFPEHGDV